MVVIDERVWSAWRGVSCEGDEWSLELAFVSAVDRHSTAAAVDAAALVAVREFEALHPELPGVDSAVAGAWFVTVRPGAVVVAVWEEPDDFPWMLGRIAEVLFEQGVEGRFEVYAPAVAVALPELAVYLECWIRLRGEPHTRHGRPSWQPAPDALEAAIATGLEWCAPIYKTGTSVLCDDLARIGLEPGDDPLEFLTPAIEHAHIPVSLWSFAGGDFRMFSIDPTSGRAAFAEGGARLEQGEWREPLSQLRTLLIDSFKWAAYGFIKSGRNPKAAALGHSLTDWVFVPHFRATTPTAAFEAQYLPDVFGIQLLGGGYAGRVPTVADWTTEPLGANAVLVEHSDPAAWYAEPFDTIVGKAYRTPEAPIPNALAQGRASYRSLLLTEDTIPDTPQ